MQKFSVTKEVEWDMGHRVPNHHSKCRNPHGHRYKLQVTLEGPLVSKPGVSSEGMVIDFGDLKDVMVKKVHDIFDHSMLIYAGDKKLLSCFNLDSMYREEIEGLLSTDMYQVISLMDHEWKMNMSSFVPTAENLSAYIFWTMEHYLRDDEHGVKVLEVRLFETPTSVATFRG